jgi:hypothetical protein
LEFYDELREACRAADDLMNRALKESRRRQKADEEVASSLHKVQLLVMNTTSSENGVRSILIRTLNLVGESKRGAVPGGGEEEGRARSSSCESRKRNLRTTAGDPAEHDQGGIPRGSGNEVDYPGKARHSLR